MKLIRQGKALAALLGLLILFVFWGCSTSSSEKKVDDLQGKKKPTEESALNSKGTDKSQEESLNLFDQNEEGDIDDFVLEEDEINNAEDNQLVEEEDVKEAASESNSSANRLLREESSLGYLGGGAGEAATEGLPEMGTKMSYIVQKGDSLSKISKRLYDDFSRWSDLARWSNVSNPNLIYPGDIVYYQLTEKTLVFAEAYESLINQKSSFNVKPGSSLMFVAKQIYGTSDKWKELWRINHSVKDPRSIPKGTTKISFIESGLIGSVKGIWKKTAHRKDSMRWKKNRV